MLPELGSYAIILAFCFAMIQWMATGYGHLRQANEYYALSKAAAAGQFVFLLSAMLCLIGCFLTNDMSVVYVQDHSHRLLPLIYRIGAAWGGHEGSLLLWCLILAGWTSVFMLAQRLIPTPTETYRIVIGVLGFISAGFILFLFAASNPFQRIFPTELVVGNDLTPVLQDPGLIFHPPILYAGYVGFAIGFAFAIAALLQGKLTSAWAKACQPWVVMPWGFLSCGIVLGSSWAYRELGWGGWWFWDPVENASLLPWLSATAFIHALIVSEKRDNFKGWTILLAIITFALSLLGTFLVRSGVLVSVHTFASDPTRGIFLLAYLTLIIGGAFLLYGLRIKDFYRAPNFSIFSREMFLLMNSVFLLTCVATILLGTLYPILLDAFDLEKISVGEPYFNTVFLPIILPLLLLMGLGPHVHWGEQRFMVLWRKIRLALCGSIVVGFLSPFVLGISFHLLASIGITIAAWMMIATLQYAYRIRNLKTLAMIIAHLGIAVIALGITVAKSYSVERQVKIHVGENIDLAGYQIRLENLADEAGANFKSTTASFIVSKGSNDPKLVSAQLRTYLSHDQSLSQPGILTNPWRDIYIALGNTLPDGSWSVRMYYKPFVRWIWAGGFILLLGGLCSLLASIRSRPA